MDKRVTIRPAFLQPINVLGAVLAAAAIVVAVVTGKIEWVGLAALFVAGIVGTHFLARIEITADQVRVYLLRFAGEAPRAEITTIHHFADRTTFEGDGKKVLLRIRGNGWTKRQLLDIADALGARLYDHSTNFGLWNVKVGKLVQRTGAAQK
jgi:hypothetical protein